MTFFISEIGCRDKEPKEFGRAEHFSVDIILQNEMIDVKSSVSRLNEILEILRCGAVFTSLCILSIR